MANSVRQSIRAKECYCTNEVLMWPSIVYQPLALAKSMLGAKAWKRADPLPETQRVNYSEPSTA